MPAPADLAQKYLNDNSDHPHADLVDSCLPRDYGEKWTTMWLDLARYADTSYERDIERRSGAIAIG